ncbi:MAG: Fic family protein [Planctomycetes bacterium]|nr:Fic family protein [Planctomycetota bacterium]
MQRGATGRMETTRVGGETVRAFVPHPLPPVPPLDLTGRLLQRLEQAQLAVGRLDSITTLLPGPDLFLYSYIRKEAVLSSQIEGTQSSLSDLLLFELEHAPGAPIDDVVEVASYVAAMEHGLAELRRDQPLSNRLIRAIHGQLLARGRGADKQPGCFRSSQNWIGGTRPGNAAFVPPPPDLVPECMGALERFLHAQDDGLPTLVRTALAHVQFETIHPFLDGNGRIGRLLITFLLCHAGVLQKPLLYLSLYFKQRRSEYYRLLDAVRKDGDWEAWLLFFLDGVAQTAKSAVDTAQRMTALFAADRERIQAIGRRAGSALRVHAELQRRPVATMTELAARTGLAFPTVEKSVQALAHDDLQIAREVTGRRRNRVFAYPQYLAMLNEGTETA